jgi:hypothetical protein
VENMAKKKSGLGGMFDDLMEDIDLLGEDDDTDRSRGEKGGSSEHSHHPGHQLTHADRVKGGKVSASKQNMRELGRKGGRA